LTAFTKRLSYCHVISRTLTT